MMMMMVMMMMVMMMVIRIALHVFYTMVRSHNPNSLSILSETDTRS
jgi:type IV secretory pathway VirB3-like protein